MDKADLIERTEIELRRVIELSNHDGLDYWRILRLIPDIITDLMIKADIEYHLRGGQ